MAVDVLSTIGSGIAFNHFFDMRVDKLQKALEKLGQSMQERGQALINSVSGEAKMQQIEAFNRLQTLIDNFGITYSDQMGKTVKKVDKAAQERLAQIDTMVYRLVSGLKSAEMQEYIQECQALAEASITAFQGKTLYNAVPVKPVLKDTSPKCIAPVKGLTHIVIRCIGFFPEVQDLRLPKPLLILKGQAFSHVSNGGGLEFSVPFSLLFSDDQGPGVIGFSVKIPYAIPGWFYNGVHHAEYRRLISLLPEFPGKISLEYVTVKEEVKDQKDIVATFWQDSKKGKHGGEHCDIINRLHAITAPVGWRIVPGSGHMHVHCNEGKGNVWSGVTEGPTQVHFTASTHKHHKERDCGKLGINLAAKIVQYHEVATTTIEDLGLTWGESRALDTSKWKSWKVIFKPFDGPERVYTGNVDGKYITIESPSGQPVVSVKHYSEVMRSAAAPEPIRARL